MVANTLYLKGLIFPGILFVLLWILSGRSRGFILLGGVSAAPLGLLFFTFMEVWTPGRIIPGNFGLEDLLFCFFSGGLTLALVDRALMGSPSETPVTRQLQKAFLVSLTGFGIILVLFRLGIKDYPNSYLAMGIMALLLVMIKRSLFKVFLAGAILFSITYVVLLILDFMAWPDLIRLWRMTNMSGILLGPIPVEDVIWAFLFGGTWPVIIHFVSGRILVGKSTKNHGKALKPRREYPAVKPST
jgi:hypothetical protein